jgi:transketolase
VVSMPCMENFDEQDDGYKDSVLPPSVRARVAVEAGSPFGWDRWTGPDGAFLGMTTFGESGPAKDVYAHFGITAERLQELAREVMDRVGARSG